MKILVLDQDLSLLKLLAYYFMPMGFECEVKTNLMDAFTYLESNEVDLIILEPLLSSIKGNEVCKAIRERWNIPIIIVTEEKEKDMMISRLKMGADDYITKPFYDQELIARITSVLRSYKITLSGN